MHLCEPLVVHPRRNLVHPTVNRAHRLKSAGKDSCLKQTFALAELSAEKRPKMCLIVWSAFSDCWAVRPVLSSEHAADGARHSSDTTLASKGFGLDNQFTSVSVRRKLSV